MPSTATLLIVGLAACCHVVLAFHGTRLPLQQRRGGGDERGTAAAVGADGGVVELSAAERGGAGTVGTDGGALELFAAGPALSAAASAPAAVVQTPEVTPHYFFFSHHKCGTALSHQVAIAMAKVLGLPFHWVKWLSVKAGDATVQCDNNDGIAVFEDMRPEVLLNLTRDCPNMRAVHLLRDLPDTLISNYVYTIDLKPGEDLPSDVARGQRLKNMSLAEGVLEECGQLATTYTPQLVETHRLIQDQGLGNVLEVRYEGLTDDYDATMASVLAHLLGASHPAMGPLTETVKKFDTSRWSEEKTASVSHVSDSSDKARVAQEMRRSHGEMSECLVGLASSNEALGYTEAFARIGALYGNSSVEK